MRVVFWSGSGHSCWSQVISPSLEVRDRSRELINLVFELSVSCDLRDPTVRYTKPSIRDQSSCGVDVVVGQNSEMQSPGLRTDDYKVHSLAVVCGSR